MADATFEVETSTKENSHAAMIKLTTGLGGAVFLLMMVFGLIMPPPRAA